LAKCFRGPDKMASRAVVWRPLLYGMHLEVFCCRNSWQIHIKCTCSFQGIWCIL